MLELVPVSMADEGSKHSPTRSLSTFDVDLAGKDDAIHEVRLWKINKGRWCGSKLAMKIILATWPSLMVVGPACYPLVNKFSCKVN